MSYELACTFKHETADAVLIYDHATEEEIWFPLSQVDSMHKDKSGKGTIVVTDYIAKKKGLL